VSLPATVLFVWQVAVDPLAQKRGLAGSMLRGIIERDCNSDMKYIETTVTKDNKASRAMFKSLARKLGTDIEESLMFDKKRHFLNLHDSEYKLRIGPFDTSRSGNVE